MKPTPSLSEAVDALIDVDGIRGGHSELTRLECPVRKTLSPMGSAQVHTLDPRELTDAEWQTLLNSWNERAQEQMKLFCDRVAPENCRKTVPLKVTMPPRFYGRPGKNGQPPHTLFMEMDITFQCQKPS